MNRHADYRRISQAADRSAHIDPAVLLSLEGATLFYPSCATDLRQPLRLFAPYIAEFWFADLAFLARSDLAKSSVAPVLGHVRDFELIAGPDIHDVGRDDAPGGVGSNVHRSRSSLVVTETYRDRGSGREFRVNRRRGFGERTLEKCIHSLGVFFYRGNGIGEGNSTVWLNGRWMAALLSKLQDGALLVTDGSSRDRSDTEYEELSRFYRDETVGDKAVTQVRPFRDSADRRFDCIGYAGERYGPTLVWRVTQPPGLRSGVQNL